MKVVGLILALQNGMTARFYVAGREQTGIASSERLLELGILPPHVSNQSI